MELTSAIDTKISHIGDPDKEQIIENTAKGWRRFKEKMYYSST
jgi:hypothetical protein